MWLVLGLALCGCKPTREMPEEADISPPLVDSSDEPPPVLDFPAAVRTDDLSLNEFIEHVFEVCRAGRYEDYRLLHSRYEKPLSRASFKELWERVESITVEGVEALPDELGREDGARPNWRVTARMTYLLDEEMAERRVRFVVSWEGQRWVVGRPPTDGTTRPAEETPAPSE
jgi:hypothetical protein